MLVGLSIALMLAIVGKGVDNNLLIWSGNVMYAAKQKQRGAIEFAPMSAIAEASTKPVTTT
jgi:hypothetical protein